ncbi:MAG TPA: hypothetical protein VGE11_12235 [Pseudonocardia sp.]
MTTMTSRPQAAVGDALAESRLAGHLIGLVFTAVVAAFFLGLFLL